jgi:hypothetical protein
MQDFVKVFFRLVLEIGLLEICSFLSSRKENGVKNYSNRSDKFLNVEFKVICMHATTSRSETCCVGKLLTTEYFLCHDLAVLDFNLRADR